MMSVASIVKNSCCDIFKKIEKDVNRWTHASVPARIAVVKMNVLPRMNFISSMFPLAPPVDYWKKVLCSSHSYGLTGIHV